MKINLFLLFLLALWEMTGCSRAEFDENGFPPTPQKMFVGTWDLVEVNGVAGAYGALENESKFFGEGAVDFTLTGGRFTGSFGGGLFSADGNTQHFAMWNMLWLHPRNGVGEDTVSTYCSVDWWASEWTENSFTLTAWENASVIDGSAPPVRTGDVWKLKKREK